MPTIPAADLERLAADIFAARDVPGDDARWIAALLVRANLRGHDSHGVIRVPQYCAALAAGHLNATPKIALVVDTASVVVLDGDFGFGQGVARRGTALPAERGRGRTRATACRWRSRFSAASCPARARPARRRGSSRTER